MSEPGSGVTRPGEPDERVLDGVIAEETGEEIIDSLRRVRHAEETRYRAEHPGEGLRERKRRLTRHLIADAATAMFASRGFDAVKVSEIADRANVSMKTLYNYFPTKESMVLDDADELIENLAAALRDRQAGMSITDAFVGALEASRYEFDLLDDELAAYVATTFAAIVKQTPALHAHWLEIQDRLARVAAEQLALQTGTDPADPRADDRRLGARRPGPGRHGLADASRPRRPARRPAARRGRRRRTPSRGTAGDRTGIAQPRHTDRRAQRPGITPGLGDHRPTQARRSSADRGHSCRESRPSKTQTSTRPGR